MSFDEHLFVKVTILEARVDASLARLSELEQCISEKKLADATEKIKEIRSILSGIYEKS